MTQHTAQAPLDALKVRMIEGFYPKPLDPGVSHHLKEDE